ncbi:lysosomal Pro-X carboxypeptidase-like isoform X1 [Homalodisca vitripennis]|uniref:lysosomal Pro-X carboxypeptidase-like isoform X1 n=2 Tax=Homalodisca vitripennis TaxID=197043 RepID=UPI001EECE7FB|nr:lysosomal Pro-X carboxypeptidase-like isoform X1 [Homalodisca vitripennis]
MDSVICGIILSVVILITTKHVHSQYVFKTEYFDAKLDHFTFLSNTTFKLRYLVNDSYWSPDTNAPIFFYTGNEDDITVFAQNTGFMWEIAPEFNALIVFAEHRFYGESLPFGNKSYDQGNIGYLSSSQALMDFVDLISELKHNHYRQYPVVLFGGSYGGMLAAWLRMEYPAAVTGAIASSAPIWQFTGMTPCNAFNRVLTSAFTRVSHKCSHNIRKSWKAINDITKTDYGKSWLSTTWKLCEPLKTSQNVTDLKNYLIDVYGNLAMVNYPYPTGFLAPLPGHPVRAVCKHLLKEDLEGKKLLNALFGAVSVYFNYTGDAQCLDYQPSLIDDLWGYQACTEMVMPMCSDGKHDMFEPSKWNFNDYAKECYEQYGVLPQPFHAKNLYGGKHISTASNIIFSNGQLDPWSSGGVLHNVSATAQAVFMADAAHHLDLRASNPADPESVVEARKYYRTVIQQWISQ